MSVAWGGGFERKMARMPGELWKTIAVGVLCGAAALSFGQMPVGAETSVAPQTTLPSDAVRSSLDELRQAVGVLRVERWKVPKDVREMTLTNVGSIRRDLDATLPGLLAAADAQPGMVTARLPLSRNLGALYDVLLRVTVIAEPSAPVEQTSALEHSMTSLDGARRELSDRLQSLAEAQEQKAAALQKALDAVPPPVVAVAAPVPCQPVAPAKKKKPAAKPAAATAGKSKN